MKPNAGYAFIIEDKKEEVSSSGIILSNKSENKAGIGTIYEINQTILCPYCVKTIKHTLFQKGDRIIYSTFVAEHLDYKEEGMPEGRLFSIPTDAILAQID